jgi:hypothetical protein
VGVDLEGGEPGVWGGQHISFRAGYSRMLIACLYGNVGNLLI